MKVVARAPAKLVLFGEYVVLEDAPAIVMAVDRCAEVRVEAADAMTIDSDLGADAGADWFDAWRSASARGRIPELHVELRTADLFANGSTEKFGLGSSAALTVAMGAALRSAAGEPVEDEHAFVADLDTHHRLQGGKGSGIDVAASFHGGVIAWWKTRHVERLTMPADLHFACVWTGTSASTTALLERVRAFGREQPAEYANCMERMGTLAHSALDAFRQGRSDEIVALAGAYHRAMADLGSQSGTSIVSPPHRDLAEIAGGRDVSYKPSGAGGGDVGLLFSTSPAALRGAVERCRKAGYHVLDVHIRDQGVTVSNS